MFNINFSNNLFLSFLLSISFSFSVFAQEIEEVVVTATKKEESVQDLAISIDALTAEDISDNLIYDIQDVAEIIPGLLINKSIGSGSQFSIRGSGSYGIGAATVSQIVTAVNGHSVNTSVMVDVSFFDSERIEVLKGPQGTLFGRNAAGGVVNVITARPTQDFGGYFDVELGDYNSEKLTMAINMPLSDSVRTRLAVLVNDKDGDITNLVTGNSMNGRGELAARLSLDWDISDDTVLKFTYSHQDASDTRTQEAITHCDQDEMYGCDPYTLGALNTSAHSGGSFNAILNLIAGLMPDANTNSAIGPMGTSIDAVYLNREPIHNSTSTVANLEIDHQLSDTMQMVMKYTYSTRDFQQTDDNDGGYSTVPFPGFLAGVIPGLPPISWTADFKRFSEIVDTDRVYNFSTVMAEEQQAEISFISDYDGAFNFVVGAYMFDQRNDNDYQVQFSATELLTSYAKHPYNMILFGGALTGYGGTGLNRAIVLGAPGSLSPAGVAGLMQLPKYITPNELAGTLNDDNVRIKSKAIYGEMYFGLSEVTKLTIGLRYNEDVVSDSLMSCTFDFDCPEWFATNGPATSTFVRNANIVKVEDDAVGGKVALQHDLSDDQMIYVSYTTATKAGGVNPTGTRGSIGIPDTYDQEIAEVLDIGYRSILMDGAVRLNANIFNNQVDGTVFAQIVNASSANTNNNSEINGFEGSLQAYLSESVRLDFNWLIVDTEIVKGIPVVDYLNPTAATGTLTTPGTFGLLDARGVVRFVTGNNGTTIFRSAGYNCLAPFNPIGEVPCPVAEGVAQDPTGNKLPYSPDVSYGFALNFLSSQNNGNIKSRLSYRYTSEMEGDIFNNDRAKIPLGKFWDAQVMYESNDGWYVGVVAKNLEDRRSMNYVRAASNLQGGMQYANYADGRHLSLKFGTTF